MNDIKKRLMANAGTKKILKEDVSEQLSELEITDRAQRAIMNLQREILSIAQYIENGGRYPSYNCSSNGCSNKDLDEETINKLKKLCGEYFNSKIGDLQNLVISSFETGNKDDEDDNYDDEDDSYDDEDNSDDEDDSYDDDEPVEQPQAKIVFVSDNPTKEPYFNY